MATSTKSPAVLEFKSCKIAEIIAWCQDYDAVPWLKEANQECKTFFQLRKLFFETYMPQQIPTKKSKTYKDVINNL